MRLSLSRVRDSHDWRMNATAAISRSNVMIEIGLGGDETVD